MRKTIFSFVGLMVTLMAFTSLASCSDSDDAQSSNLQPQTSESGQYLVMFYGVGGGNLDDEAATNFMQAVCIGNTDKVKMTFQYRFSKKMQSTDTSFTGVRRFTAEENADLIGKMNTNKEKYDTAETYNLWRKNLHSTSIGDNKYIMASDTALTAFIKWSKEKYPNATKTVLVFKDHGGGWNLLDDGKYNGPSTRGMIYDDNSIYKDNTGTIRNRCLSATSTVNGINNAGGVDAIYTDACLMATWENITEYSKAAKFFLGSVETTPGIGGCFANIINRLQENEVTDDGLHKALNGCVDYYIDNILPEAKKAFNIANLQYTDLGCYDLRNIGVVLPVIKTINDSLASKAASDEPIPGTISGKSCGTKWRTYLNSAVMHSVSACSAAEQYISEDLVPEPMIKDLTLDDIKPYKDGTYDANTILSYLQNTDPVSALTGPYSDDYMALWKRFSQITHQNYGYADMLRILNDSLATGGVQDADNPFILLRSKYLEALNKMCYIRCTNELSAERVKELNMGSYVLDTCSPTIFIYSFDEDTYNNPDIYKYNKNYHQYLSYSDAVAYYTSTYFDQQTGWSNVLKHVTTIPNLITNVVRKNIK